MPITGFTIIHRVGVSEREFTRTRTNIKHVIARRNLADAGGELPPRAVTAYA